MRILTIVFVSVIILNAAIACYTVFSSRKREVASTWAWLFAMTMFPGLGLIAYFFLGRKLTEVPIFSNHILNESGLTDAVSHQKNTPEALWLLEHKGFQIRTHELVSLLLKSNDALMTEGNTVTIIEDGEKKFKQLIADIKQAKHHIHLIYFIFRMDEIGTEILEALEDRAKEGVKVRLLYEPAGAKALNKGFFDRLRSYGGEAETFFGPRLLPVNFRTNFRMHRKIAVVDGKTGYTGGFNVGNDYLGLYEQMGYWRDTHLRIVGPAVQSLQARFFMDWNAAVSKRPVDFSCRYFPPAETKGTELVQIVTSGPDNEVEAIKKGFIKMISLARKTIHIQTPYFIPDEAMMESIKVALLSGVSVSVMIPNKPDHPLIYRATLSYIEEIVCLGASVYVYEKGFLHSKSVVIDSEIVSIGTANFDIRSFRLNFEVTAFIYDAQKAREQLRLFEADSKVSSLLSENTFSGLDRIERIRRQISRLFSPIL